ncbi:MAG: ion channel [Marmoricola sp.]
MTWAMSAAGVVLLVCALRDVFHTVWHPAGFGSLSRLVFKTMWRVTKLTGRRTRASTLAGPFGLLVTLGVWASLSVLGFALVYVGRMPEGFYFGSSLDPQASSDVLMSLYVSMVALATLGLGDVVPATALLRVVLPLEALVGFVLLTAGISWVLQLYPALSRRRSLARRLSTMAGSGAADVVENGEPGIAVQHLEGVRAELAAIEMDLVQYAESYYFRDVRPEVSLAATLPHVADLAAAGTRSSAWEVRQAGEMLASGLHDVLALLRRDHLGDVGDDAATLLAFAREHQQPTRD